MFFSTASILMFVLVVVVFANKTNFYLLLCIRCIGGCLMPCFHVDFFFMIPNTEQANQLQYKLNTKTINAPKIRRILNNRPHPLTPFRNIKRLYIMGLPTVAHIQQNSQSFCLHFNIIVMCSFFSLRSFSSSSFSLYSKSWNTNSKCNLAPHHITFGLVFGESKILLAAQYN